MTSASGMKCRNKVGIAARPQDQLPAGQGLGLQRSRPKAPAQPSDLSRHAGRDQIYPRRQLAAACPESGVADAMIAISAVPELTRGIDIKLNAQLSLRGYRSPIASSHRTRPVRIRDPSDHTSTWRLYLRETADGRRLPGF